jgi:hypothetical protein
MRTNGRSGAAWRAAAAALALAVAAAAAAGPDDAADAGSEDGGPQRRGALTSAESFYVEWWTEPEPIPLNEMFVVHFRVLEPGDRRAPVHDAVVTASARMPEHNHGTTLQPHIDSHGDGTATGHGFLLHMEGTWQLRVAVAVGARMERATFDVDLAP